MEWSDIQLYNSQTRGYCHEEERLLRGVEVKVMKKNGYRCNYEAIIFLENPECEMERK